VSGWSSERRGSDGWREKGRSVDTKGTISPVTHSGHTGLVASNDMWVIMNEYSY